MVVGTLKLREANMSDTNTIRSLNDRFRRGDANVPGQILMTQGIAALLTEQGLAPLDIATVVQAFDDFTEDNDPHKEHDFGAFEFEAEKCFWKIDYYDPTQSFGSDDPTDVTKTHRVMTIMLASEY